MSHTDENRYDLDSVGVVFKLTLWGNLKCLGLQNVHFNTTRLKYSGCCP